MRTLPKDLLIVILLSIVPHSHHPLTTCSSTTNSTLIKRPGITDTIRIKELLSVINSYLIEIFMGRRFI
jgi:hypothetical protein